MSTADRISFAIGLVLLVVGLGFLVGPPATAAIVGAILMALAALPAIIAPRRSESDPS